jgi:TP901 family phage tail tape measure protein
MATRTLNVLLTGDATALKASFLSAAKGAPGVVGAVAAVTVAAGAAGKALYDIGGEFEHANNIIRAGTGATGKHLKKLEDDFKSVVSHVPASFEEAATAVTELNKRLGLTGKPLRESSHQFLELSRMTGSDLQGNIKGVARAFEDWEVSTKKQGPVLDEFFRASQKSGGSVEELAEQVNKFGPQLRNLHIPLGKSIALFASFEKAGVSSSKMGMALNLAFKNLVHGTTQVPEKIAPKDTGKKVLEIFKGMESGAVSANRAFEVFGSKGGGALIQAIKQGRFHVGEFQKAIENSKGAIDKTGEATKTTSDHFAELGNKLKVLVAPAAEFVYDSINKLAGALAKVNFRKLLREAGPTFREIGDIVKQMAGVIGPVIGDALKGAAQFFKGFAQVVKGVVEVISGLLHGEFGKAWQGVKDIFSGGVKATMGILRAISAPIRAIVGAVGGAMGKGFSAAWDTVTGIFKTGKEAVVDVLNTIIEAINVIPGISIGTIGGSGGGGSPVKHQYPTRKAHEEAGHHYSGGAITRPTAIVGEEAPQHPEWVIATNPAYRRNNLSYWAQAGHDLGVPGFLSGGSIASGIGSAVGTAISSLPMTGGTPSAATASSVIGNLPTPHLPQPFTGLGPWLISKVTNWIKSQFESVVGGGGGSKGPNGVGSFMGLPMADWVIESLRFAQGKGVPVRPTSGYRPGYDPHTASGHSEHSGTQYPHGAVDFGGFTDPAALAMKMGVVHATAGFKYPLLAPIGFHDDGHASGTGHYKGGLLGRFAKGGRLPSWVHGSGSLNADQLASLAHYVGAKNPGLMSQIAQAESGGNPHSMGGEGDKGLWQIIPSTAAAFGINYGGLFDPLANAIGMKKILDGQGINAWHTYTSGAYSGYSKGSISPLGSTGGGGAGGSGSGAKKFTPHIGIGKAQNAGGVSRHTALTVGGLSPSALSAAAGALPPALQAMLKAPGIGYAGQLAIAEQAATIAQGTEGTADDAAARAFEGELLEGQKGRLQKQLTRLNAKLKKGGMTAKARAKVLAKREEVQGELLGVEGSIAGLSGEGEETAQKQIEATEALTAALQEHTQAEQDLANEMKQTRELSEQAMSTSSAVAWRALADMLSGNLGARTLASAQTAGAGGVGSF